MLTSHHCLTSCNVIQLQLLVIAVTDTLTDHDDDDRDEEDVNCEYACLQALIALLKCNFQLNFCISDIMYSC